MNCFAPERSPDTASHAQLPPPPHRTKPPNPMSEASVDGIEQSFYMDASNKTDSSDAKANSNGVMPDADSCHHDGSHCDGNHLDSERADSRGAS
eukprot:3032510-Pleurochrysis_carterae.AAC.1